MGFNFSGIAFNKNYENDFETLQKELGWNLEKQGDIIFEEASENWKDEAYCDVYYTENGTLLFAEFDRCLDAITIDQVHTLSFGVSESSMTFSMHYCEDGELKRALMEVDGATFEDIGDPLPIEKENPAVFDVIFAQLKELIGQEFFGIDLAVPCTRYVFKKAVQPISEPKAVVQEAPVSPTIATEAEEPEQVKETATVAAAPETSTTEVPTPSAAPIHTKTESSVPLSKPKWWQFWK